MYLFLNNLSKYYDCADEDTGLRTVPSRSVGAGAMSQVRELILGLPDGRGLALLGIDCLKAGKFWTGLRS